MTDPTHEPIMLSPEGLRRKRAIEASLLRSAADRRTGRRVLAAAGCLAVSGIALLAVRLSTIPASPPSTTPRTIAASTPAAPLLPVRPSSSTPAIRIVTNVPLPSVNCGQTRPASNSLSVCLLDDQQLLAALSQTGESYGIVRIGGKTRVVTNLAIR